MSVCCHPSSTESFDANTLEFNYDILLKFVRFASNYLCCDCCERCLACEARHILKKIGELK